MINKIKEFRYRRLKYKAVKNILKLSNYDMILMISFMLTTLSGRGVNTKMINSTGNFVLDKMPFEMKASKKH